jgi:hypothetical protein
VKQVEKEIPLFVSKWSIVCSVGREAENVPRINVGTMWIRENLKTRRSDEFYWRAVLKCGLLVSL